MDKLQDLSQSELEDLLDNTERVESMALESDEFVTAGSFALACEKSPSRQLLTGCAYTNVASLVAGLLALCLYSVSLHSVQGSAAPCTLPNTNLYTLTAQKCPGEYLKEFFRSLIVLLIVYDLGALTLHSLLSFSALKGLRVGLCQMIN